MRKKRVKMKIKVTDLKPHPQNPNKHSKSQIEKLKKTIKELGWGRPILISKDNYILAGHGAIEAAKELGIEEVPYRRVKYNHDDPEAIALMIADNRLQEYSSFDRELLEKTLKTLSEQDFNIKLTGFNEIPKIYYKIDNIILNELGQDKIAKTGDLYKLGQHKLLCADATKKENVKGLFGNAYADMIFTDPPHEFEENKKLAQIFDIISKDTNIFLLHEDSRLVEYLKSNKFNFKQFFVVDTTIAMSRGSNPYKRHLLISHETKGNPQSNIILYDGFTSIIKAEHRHRLREQRYHPQQKPIELPSKFIQHYTKEGDIVADLFAGSGNTLLACEQLQRKCYAMEINPEYCDIIIKRWEKYTGQKAQKIN